MISGLKMLIANEVLGDTKKRKNNGPCSLQITENNFPVVLGQNKSS